MVPIKVKGYLLAVFALLCTVATANAQAITQDSKPNKPINIDRASQLFALAKTLSDADGGKLWGVRLYGPILFVDPQSRMIVTNKIDKQQQLTKHSEDVYVGILPDEIGIANTTTKWAGVSWAMVMWPPPRDPEWAASLLLHESFHRIQPKLGLKLSSPDNHHLDTADGRIWLRLEYRALAKTLNEVEPLDSAALRDALIFRNYRRSLFKLAKKEERLLELNEGLAEYTGIKLCGADEQTQYKRAVMNLKMHDQSSPLVRRFAYGSGPAYGLLLDKAKPGWQREPGKTVDYGKQLQRAIGYRLPRDLKQQALSRAEQYNFEKLSKEEIDRDNARKEKLAAYRKKYVDAPLLLLDMIGDYNYSFNPGNMQALDGIGTVYGTMELSAPWGILKVTGGALMIETPKGLRRILVPAPQDTGKFSTNEYQGEGWTLKLNSGYTLIPGPRSGDYSITP
ncbi:MAG: hypothetical protein IH984_03665 [Planctomycetes bacterium]|nr:hypothetical protein [Planctomycetota bacterium]